MATKWKQMTPKLLLLSCTLGAVAWGNFAYTEARTERENSLVGNEEGKSALPSVREVMKIADIIDISPMQCQNGGKIVTTTANDGNPDLIISRVENSDLLSLVQKILNLPSGTLKPTRCPDYLIYVQKYGSRVYLDAREAAQYEYWMKEGILGIPRHDDTHWGVVSEEFRVKVNALLIKRRKEIEAAHRVVPPNRPRVWSPTPPPKTGLPLPRPL